MWQVSPKLHLINLKAKVQWQLLETFLSFADVVWQRCKVSDATGDNDELLLSLDFLLTDATTLQLHATGCRPAAGN